MSRKIPMIGKYLLLFVFIVTIGIIAVLISQRYIRGPGQGNEKWGTRPGGAEEHGGPPQGSAYKRWSGPIPQPPKGEVAVYKGFWSAPVLYLRSESPFSNVDKVKEMGANMVSFGPHFFVDKDGNIGFPWDFPTIEDLDARIGELTSIYYPKGIRIHLVLSTNYVETITKDAGGEPQPFPRELAAKKGYLDKYNKLVEEMVKIAQKYQVEYFSPLNEPDGTLGIETAYKWNEEILPRIRKYYQGKLCYKGDLHNGEGEDLNFKGYDMLGYMPSPPTSDSGAEFRKLVAWTTANAIKWAKRDGVPKVMVAEFGAWKGMNLTENEVLARYQILFEEGQGKINGFAVIDPPPDQPDYMKGSVINEIKKWYTTKL